MSALPLRKSCLFVFLLAATSTFYFLLGNSTENPVSNNVEITVGSFPFTKTSLPGSLKPPVTTAISGVSFARMLDDPTIRFNMENNDVIVVLHIQKTAGTSFEKFLVRHLDVEHPCDCSSGRKRCICRRPGDSKELWLFSRYSTGWVCGLHADFTELFVSGCVTKMLDKKEGGHRDRRYFTTTFLRDPVTRTISEFRHVNRGATWMASRHLCGGHQPTSEELPSCFDPEDGWEGVTLDEFLDCPHNLAFNRQTRMLADLTLAGCYSSGMNITKRDAIILESAKENLRNLAFFGLKERMADSQLMFYRQFGLRFTKHLDEWTKSKSNDTEVTDEQLEKIRKRNHLDIQLYDYAHALFEQRISVFHQKYPVSEVVVVHKKEGHSDSISFRRKNVLDFDGAVEVHDEDSYENDNEDNHVEFAFDRTHS